MSRATCGGDSFAVGIPCYNESANIRHLLQILGRDLAIHDIIVADDQSNDGTQDIVRDLILQYPNITLSVAAKRSGQLAGWLRAAASTNCETIVFIDADSVPFKNAVSQLARSRGSYSVISGRIVPASSSDSALAGRFSAQILHHLRSLQKVREAIIGRFFAVDRKWFLRVVRRTDIIANDTYLACLARTNGNGYRYCGNIATFYSVPSLQRDFAAQRQRADAGYRQLMEMGLLATQDMPTVLQTLGIIAKCALKSPSCASAWLLSQVYSIRHGANDKDLVPGIWDSQKSTKRGLSDEMPQNTNTT